MLHTPIAGNRVIHDIPDVFLQVNGKLNSARGSAYQLLGLRSERPYAWNCSRGSYYVDVIDAYGRRNGGAIMYESIASRNEFRLLEEDRFGLVPS